MCHRCHLTTLALVSAALLAAEKHDPEAAIFGNDYDPSDLTAKTIYDYTAILSRLHPNEEGELQNADDLAKVILGLGVDRLASVALVAHHIAYASTQIETMLNKIIVGFAANGDQRALERLAGQGPQGLLLVMFEKAEQAARERGKKSDAEVIDELLSSLPPKP